MGLQIPRGICSEIQAEEVVWKVSEKSRGDISAFMLPAWSRTYRRALTLQRNLMFYISILWVYTDL